MAGRVTAGRVRPGAVTVLKMVEGSAVTVERTVLRIVEASAVTVERIVETSPKTVEITP